MSWEIQQFHSPPQAMLPDGGPPRLCAIGRIDGNEQLRDLSETIAKGVRYKYTPSHPRQCRLMPWSKSDMAPASAWGSPQRDS